MTEATETPIPGHPKPIERQMVQFEDRLDTVRAGVRAIKRQVSASAASRDVEVASVERRLELRES